MNRSDCLQKAARTITKFRHEEYGDFKVNAANVAAGWTVIFGVEVAPHQVALALDWFKSCRLVANPTHEDSWVDKAGYTALGVEIATNDSASDRIAVAETDYPVEDGYPIETMERMTGRG